MVLHGTSYAYKSRLKTGFLILKSRLKLLILFFFSQESDSLWWDAFATEFFEEDATLTLSFCLEDGPKRYSKNTAGISF